jgi:hypothetical protein
MGQQALMGLNGETMGHAPCRTVQELAGFPKLLRHRLSIAVSLSSLIAILMPW